MMKPAQQHSALLVMDMQTGILGNFPDAAALREKVVKAIAHARLQNTAVFYIRVGFRPGMPEISLNNKSFTANKERLAHTNMEEWMQIDPAMGALPGEMVITKRRISAFSGSDLEIILRAQGIQHLILTGIATGGVVLSTVREAADKDYRITVLSDACGDADPEVHRVLTTKVFPRQADVLTTAEWISS